MQVATGGSELVLAGGTESMSRAEFYATEMRWGVRGDGVRLDDRLARARITAGGKNFPVPGGMIETAENLRAEYSISRSDQDALAVQSHLRAVAAQRSGIFADEIVVMPVPQRKSDPIVVDTDEHPRADTTIEALAKLRPIRSAIDPDATVTAGNASGQNDGAAVCIVTTAGQGAETGLRPLGPARLLGGRRGTPATMGIGPGPRHGEGASPAEPHSTTWRSSN